MKHEDLINLVEQLIISPPTQPKRPVPKALQHQPDALSFGDDEEVKESHSNQGSNMFIQVIFIILNIL